MKLTRYPDGGTKWRLLIWSRHPSSSLTWTHILEASLYRRESDAGGWRVFCHGGFQRQYGVMLGRLTIQMVRQDPAKRSAE